MDKSKDIKSSELTYKILEEADDLSDFDCSKDDILGLNEFIHKEALDYQKEKLGTTYLFFNKQNIVGYVTLAMSQLETKFVDETNHSKISRKFYPALLIGRLGVDNKFRDRNIGTNLCLWCLGKADDISKEIGCRLVILQTQVNVVDFYRKSGFKIGERQIGKQRVFMYQRLP